MSWMSRWQLMDKENIVTFKTIMQKKTNMVKMIQLQV